MSDQFGVSTQQNLLTGGDGAKLYGWNLLNSANATIADVNITNAGLLTLLASVTADPNNATFTVPFVYQNITGDFDIDTYMAQSNPGTKRYGLICRDPNASAGEDWLGLVNENGGTSYNNTINSVTSQYAAGGTAFAYYRITRVGSVFTAYNKINSGDSWSAVGQVITRNDFAGTIQVGLYSTNDALAGNRTVFDYFEGTNSGGAASITTTALASSLNPAAAGADVTFTATVTGTSPTGTVTLKDGAATLGTGTLNVSYQAAYSTSSLTAGTHSITAVYGGDSNNSGSTSSAVNQVINTVSTISASLNLPHLTDSGACSQSGNFCDNPLPLFTLDGKFATAADAAFAIPVFTSAGSVGGSNLSYALITGFSLLINGSLIGGVGASGKFELPVFTVISKMAATAALKLPLFKTDVEYLTGRIADTRMLRLPRLKIVTLVFNPPIIHGATGFPVIGISASALTGGCCDFDATLPAIKMPSLPYANAYAGGVSRAAALTPAFLASAAGYGQYKGSAAVAMAVFAVESMMSFVETTNTRVIVLNINTGAVTEYTGYDFNGFCQWGDGYFAEGDSGIYILGGQTDDGSPINCRIKTSKTQLKNARGGGESSIKHIPAVYAVVKTPQPYVFKAVTDDGIEHVYQPEATEAARSEGTTPRKIKLGKGMKGRYWQFAIENTAGAPLEIESFEPEVAATSRRV